MPFRYSRLLPYLSDTVAKMYSNLPGVKRAKANCHQRQNAGDYQVYGKKEEEAALAQRPLRHATALVGVVPEGVSTR